MSKQPTKADILRSLREQAAIDRKEFRKAFPAKKKARKK